MAFAAAEAAASGSVILTNPELPTFSAAVQKGGAIKLNFDGRIVLAHELTISNDTTIDATGHQVTIDANGSSRHFEISAPINCRLVNITLTNGTTRGADGGANQDGLPGLGGSIHMFGGSLYLANCRFFNNAAIGGNGGPTAMTNNMVPTIAARGAAACGGALYCSGGFVAITNCLFEANVAQGGLGGAVTVNYTGGGGAAYGGALYLTNATFGMYATHCTNNTALGGALSPDGRLGQFLGGGSAYGGAVAVLNSAGEVSECSLVVNQALGTNHSIQDPNDNGNGLGGALFHDGGTLNLIRTDCSGNTALGGDARAHGFVLRTSGDGRGGAICHRSGIMEIRESVIVSNEATGGIDLPATTGPGVKAGDAAGGGILSLATLKVINSTIAENTARAWGTNGLVPGSAFGGGIFCGGQTASLLNVTVAGNSLLTANLCYETCPQSLGSSIAVTNASVFVTNTILSSLPTNVFGTLNDGGHNICSDFSAGFTSPTSLNNTDPLLGQLTSSSDSDSVMPLLTGSPAIDAGDDGSCPGTDQRQIPRPIGPHCDIGASEYVPHPTIRLQSAGSVYVTYIRQPSRRWIVDMSTNLLDWFAPTARASDTNGVVSLEDANSEHSTRRFYRLRPR